MISVARDPVDAVSGTSRHNVKRGAYVLREDTNANLTLASYGSSLHHAIRAASQLEGKHSIKSRIVSQRQVTHQA